MKKYFLYLLTFISLLGIGFFVSDVQSDQAEFTLATNGLTENARQISTKKSQTIRQLINYVDKKYATKDVQLQLLSLKKPNEVLTWANYDLTNFPIESGRYFKKSDFSGSVTFGLANQKASANIFTTQGHNYLKNDDSYYALVGMLKESFLQNRYYITTGIQQDTNGESVSDYHLIVDGLNSNQIKQLARHLKGKISVPDFIKHAQNKNSNHVLQFGLTISLIIVVLVLAVLLALQTASISIRSNVKGKLLKNLLTNKIIRYVGFSALIYLVSFLIVSYFLYLTNYANFSFILLIVWLLAAINFGLTVLFTQRKDSTKRG